MTLVLPILLDMVKPPRDIFRSGAVAGGATVIEQPMTLTDALQNSPLLCLASVTLIGRRQYLHSDAGAILSNPGILSVVIAVTAQMLVKPLARFARTADIANFVASFQVQAVNVKHKILRTLPSRRIALTISAVTANSVTIPQGC